MRLANESMKDPSEGSRDEMILVALILLYFNVSEVLSINHVGANIVYRLAAATSTNTRSTSMEYIK